MWDNRGVSCGVMVGIIKKGKGIRTLSKTFHLRITLMEVLKSPLVTANLCSFMVNYTAGKTANQGSYVETPIKAVMLKCQQGKLHGDFLVQGEKNCLPWQFFRGFSVQRETY